jgi:hypothetical protein
MLLSLAVLLLPGASWSLAQPEGQPKEKKEFAILSRKPLKPDEKDDELRKLQIERYNAALAAVKHIQALVVTGRKSPDGVMDAMQHLVESALDIYEKPEERLGFLEDYVQMAQEIEKTVQAQVQAGMCLESDYQAAKFRRADAEIRLLKAKRAVENPKSK